MNRQIYGFTLFVFIVKSAFLVYWVFLAPVNFLSIIAVDSEPMSDQSVVETVAASPTHKPLQPTVRIESAEIDFERQNVTARLNIANTKENWFASPVEARLSLFNENSQLVWQSETKLRFYGSCGSNASGFVPPQIADFEKFSAQLAALNLKQNYYAQIVILPEKKAGSDEAIYQPSELQSVLLVAGKK